MDWRKPGGFTVTWGDCVAGSRPCHPQGSKSPVLTLPLCASQQLLHPPADPGGWLNKMSLGARPSLIVCKIVSTLLCNMTLRLFPMNRWNTLLPLHPPSPGLALVNRMRWRWCHAGSKPRPQEVLHASALSFGILWLSHERAWANLLDKERH